MTRRKPPRGSRVTSGDGQVMPLAAGREAPGSGVGSVMIETPLGDWAMTCARIVLGLVCLWFGTNELIQPHLWTGYVPIIPTTGILAVILVLVHGGALFVFGIALVLGIVPRIVALFVALLLLEIVLTLSIGHGVNDIAVRDLGIFGLAVAIAGSTRQRLLLTR